MTDLLTLALRMRQHRVNDETRALEHVARVERAQQEEAERSLDLAGEEMRRLAQGRGATVCVGQALSPSGSPYPVLLPAQRAWSDGHWTVTGSTGAGKSFLVLSLLLQRLRRERGGVVLIDMKGEFAELLRKVVLPAFAASLPPEDLARFVSKVAVLAPFDPNAVPPFQVLARDPGLSIAEQAHEVAGSFGRTIGRDLGVLQETILKRTLELAIDTGHRLPDVTRLLMDEGLRRAALDRSTLEETRLYFATRFSRERASSLGSLLSRLDSLTMYPGLRRMLSAPGMVRIPRLIEDAIVIIDLGGAPAGMRDVPQFLGQLFFQRLVRAIIARPVRHGDAAVAPVTIIADEFQELLGPEVARDFERVLALARSKKCFLWMLFQQAAQVEAVSPTLLRLLRGLCNYQVHFRASIEDARAFSHILPTTGRQLRPAAGFPDPRQPDRFLSAEDERRELLELVPRMPDRIFWFCNRRAAYPSLLVRSPHLDIPGMQRTAERLPPAVRQAVERGVVALDAEAEQPERPSGDAAPASPSVSADTTSADRAPGAPLDAEEGPKESSPPRKRNRGVSLG